MSHHSSFTRSVTACLLLASLIANSVGVAAVSAADNTPSPSPSPSAASATSVFTSLRVDVGGNGYTEKATGLVWEADHGYTAAPAKAWGYWGPRSMQVISVSRGIAGAAAAPVYQTQRLGVTGYQFTVPNDKYKVTVRLAELHVDAVPGSNVFDIFCQNSPMLSGVDIAKAAGLYKAYDVTFNCTVSNSILTITFVAKSGTVALAGLDVENAAAVALPTPAAVTSKTATAVPTASPSAIVPVTALPAPATTLTPAATTTVTATATATIPVTATVAAATLTRAPQPSPTATTAITTSAAITPTATATASPSATATTAPPATPSATATIAPAATATPSPSATAPASTATPSPSATAPASTATPSSTATVPAAATTAATPTALAIPTVAAVPAPSPSAATTRLPATTPTALAQGWFSISRGVFTVVYQERDLQGALDVLDAMDVIQARVSQEVGLEMAKTEVKLFATRDDYNAALGLTAPPDQVGNAADDTHIWLLAPHAENAIERDDIIKGVHVEMTRQVLARIANMPLWMRDGIASYEARLWNDARQQFMHSLVTMRRLASLRGLEGQTYNYLGGSVTANTVIDYLTKTYGTDGLIRLVADLKTHTLEEAFPAVLGVSYSEFDRNWVSYVRTTYGR